MELRIRRQIKIEWVKKAWIYTTLLLKRRIRGNGQRHRARANESCKWMHANVRPSRNENKSARRRYNIVIRSQMTSKLVDTENFGGFFLALQTNRHKRRDADLGLARLILAALLVRDLDVILDNGWFGINGH